MSQKKVKFNIIDIIVVLVLIAGIAAVGVRMFGRQQPASDPATGDTYRVTFYAECVPEAVANSLVQDSKCEDGSRNMDLGTLVEFTIGESVAYAADSKGNLVQTVKPGYVSVTLVCELTASGQPTGLQVGKNMLNVGHSVAVCCGITEINCIVLGIDAAA